MKRILLLVAFALSACSTPPKTTPDTSTSASGSNTSAETAWRENGLRFPASVGLDSPLEERYCSAMSTFNMKISKAKGAIPRAACQELIRSNASVCSQFAFCQNDGAKLGGQNRTRVNLMIDSLNEKIAGGAKSIRAIDNLKFKARLQSNERNDAVGFSDLFQIISSGQE